MSMRLFCAAALLAAISKPTLAQVDAAQRFELASTDEQPIREVPLAAQPITVVLKMAGDPVAVVRSRAPGKRISESERRSIADSLRRQQDDLERTIEAMGGRVDAKLQHAINGIKVTATPAQLASIATLPGVVGIKPVLTYKPVNAVSVPFIGAPAVWGGSPAFHGEGIKLAIVDTGADYTHANFGGPGTIAAFNAAFANSTKPADPKLFGPNAPKIKGGTDLVGDDYNASATLADGSPDVAKRTPHPDPNPLDCNGHGSHVAGTAAGFGETDDGKTFHGPYNASTPNVRFRIGPGVAPLADVYAVRVFGCAGSTNVVVEAIDWAVANDMDIISMSLGADFGPSDTADAEAATQAAEAGVIVVSAAGNAGQSVYFTGSPAAADKTLAAAAMDSTPSFPGARVTLNTSKTFTALNSNGRPTLPTASLPIQVLRTGTAVSLGCSEAEYMNTTDGSSKVAGNVVVALRGVCARIYRAQAAFAHGAAGAALINNAAGLPPFEGDIFSCIPGATPDNANGRPCEQQVPTNGKCANGVLTGTGAAARCVETPVLVTTPFLGVAGASGGNTDATNLIAATSLTLAPATLANPGFRLFAGFTSGGPRNLDSFLKPDTTAPGVSILSTAIGTGDHGVRLSGTSMATPHVSGVAALALQSHPTWDPEDVRLAIANTSDASQLIGFQAKLGGSGLVQPFAATRTSVVARGTREAGNVSFGVQEFSRDFSGDTTIWLRNLGSSTQTLVASVVKGASTATPATSLNSPHSVSVSPSTVTLKRGEGAEVRVRLDIPAGTAGAAATASGPAGAGGFRQASGLVTFSPATAGGNGGAQLSVPYFLVARARSEVRAKFAEDEFGPARPSTTAELRNDSQAVTGTADFYAWGLRGKNKKLSTAGLRAVGVQSFDVPANALGLKGTDPVKVLIFAVNVFNAWTTPVINEYDILVDVNGDGKFDFAVFSVGLTSGRVRVNIVDLSKSPPAAVTQTVVFNATAPTNESTILMPIVAKDVGITAANPRFSYGAQGSDGFTGDFDFLGENADGTVAANAGRFNAFSSAVSTGAFATLAPRARTSVPLTINAAEFAATPALGVMVVGMENFSGKAEASLLRFERGEDDED